MNQRMQAMILQLKGISAALENSEATIVELGNSVELLATTRDAIGAEAVDFIAQKLGDNSTPGEILAVLEQATFWVKLLENVTAVDAAINAVLSDAHRCPACGCPEIEPVEEGNVEAFGSEWVKQPWDKLIYFCPHCESTGTMAQIKEMKHLVIPWRTNGGG